MSLVSPFQWQVATRAVCLSSHQAPASFSFSWIEHANRCLTATPHFSPHKCRPIKTWNPCERCCSIRKPEKVLFAENLRLEMYRRGCLLLDSIINKGPDSPCQLKRIHLTLFFFSHQKRESDRDPWPWPWDLTPESQVDDSQLEDPTDPQPDDRSQRKTPQKSMQTGYRDVSFYSVELPALHRQPLSVYFRNSESSVA